MRPKPLSERERGRGEGFRALREWRPQFRVNASEHGVEVVADLGVGKADHADADALISIGLADTFPSLLGKVARSAGWGVARSIGPSRIARPSLRNPAGPDLLSVPHPAFGHLPRFAEKGEPSSPWVL